MAKDKIAKTNAMRLLDEAGVAYRMSSYEPDGEIGALHTARVLGINPELIYKTLVLEDGEGGHFVAIVPADADLDLKKTAAHFGVKHVQLINWRTLRDLTGYIRGGCSPLAMKKPFPTVIEETAQLHDEFYISAGVRGTQIVVNPEALAPVIDAGFADIIQ